MILGCTISYILQKHYLVELKAQICSVYMGICYLIIENCEYCRVNIEQKKQVQCAKYTTQRRRMHQDNRKQYDTGTSKDI